jgi:rfaE bifunctional protein nucleotidyltransferase chain/domain
MSRAGISPGGSKMGRVVSLDELLQAAGRERRGPRGIVFTNGCFDLLHPGHIRTLEAARSLGELLVVGINSDRSVRSLKGPLRPLVHQAERAEILAALSAVDYVVIFDEDTPRNVIARLLPDVLVKGADWGAGEIVGRAEVEAAGGRVESIPLEKGYSTSEILNAIRRGIEIPAVRADH